MTSENVSNGLLICMEGIDGAGKDTQVDLLSTALNQRGIRASVFRFPDYAGVFGGAISLALKDRSFDPFALQLLFSAERFRQAPSLRNALSTEQIVVLSRYKASSYVYAVARGLPHTWAEVIEAPLPDPTLTILLDIDASTSIQRTGGNDVLERNHSLMERCRAGYLQMAAGRSDWSVIDGTMSPAAIATSVERIVIDLLNSLG